ncbi:restriction endonuclease subunit S [Marinobacter sp. W-8]|uniref:restriction endonuclease subunit S n=1 Tax=Marinobacter sp. W-8 TaxID=3369658 RepID=UPI0037C7DF9E
MSSEWRQVSLKDVLATIIDYRGKTPPKSKGGVPVLTAANVKGGRVITEKVSFISQETYDKVTTRGLPQEGDILITTEAPVGEVAPFPNDRTYHITRRIMALRCDTKIADPNFLLYTLLGEGCQQQLRNRTRGSTVPRVLKTDITNLNFLLPPLATQKVIGGFLSSLDKKIQLNQQINQTLEKMAHAIFKSWFVDFDPVKAKIEALDAGCTDGDVQLAAIRAITGKDAEQLSQMEDEHPEQYAELLATAELFPSAMRDSELGEIPEEWDAQALSRMVDLIGGGTPKKSEPNYWGGDICWFSVKDAPRGGNVFVVDTEDKITEAGLSGSSAKLLPLGTTIITARGTVGKLALTGIATAMNQSCYGVVGSDGTGPYLNYLRLYRAVDTLKRNTHGAVFDTITRTTFETVIQAQAPLELRRRFEERITPVFEMIKKNLYQIKTLTDLRDALLPRLLSGELTPLNTDEPPLQPQRGVAHV